MAVVHDHIRFSLRPTQRQALKQYFKNEAAREDARAALRDEAKDERSMLKAKGFNLKALRQAVADRRRELGDADDPDLKEARDLYVDALARNP